MHISYKVDSVVVFMFMHMSSIYQFICHHLSIIILFICSSNNNKRERGYQLEWPSVDGVGGRAPRRGWKGGKGRGERCNSISIKTY